MLPRLEEGEEIELEFSAFDWTKWSVFFNGSWDTFYFTDRRIIIKARGIALKSSMPWENVSLMVKDKKGLRIKGTWKGKEMLIVIKDKKLDGNILRMFQDIARSRGKNGDRSEGNGV